MLHDVHRLAVRYHWSEDQILRLTLPRRAAYLAIIEAEDDRRLFDALGEG
ncbi:hypothetical protein [Corallococcus exercitus]|uniref:Uncharacterized protein n=1 Tax=Corallococcus exercitus TaxID=2316736 RepID=A0A7Y4KRB3_9BACT|nr:hypothetical protein [Corallococcus exercitus]NOK38398.1 hypothetical protein [Corallococcus exercitus]